MSRTERFHISHSRKIDSAHRFVSAAHEAGVIMNTGEGANGRYVTVDGGRYKNFGSCSYMGLEALPELREPAHRALEEYGTQFHFSRAFVQCPLYLELESLLEQITGRPIQIAASTTLAHMAALPVLIRESDRIIIDQFAHASLHTAVQLLPSVPTEILRHNRIDQLDTRLKQLRQQHTGDVWYIADGLYSMLGDFASFAELRELLDRHDNLRLYIDDAHATSWLGARGRGAALEHFADDERVVVALSLNKAFSAAGGAVALPNREVGTRIRRCGGPMLFSGPIQPPMLGAGVGSARLHLSDRFPVLQSELEERLDLTVKALMRTNLERVTLDRSPIFQVQCPSPRVVFKVADLMKHKGYYCCICVFPAVPMSRPGIRFTVTRHNPLEDIEPFVTALAASVEEALAIVARGDDSASSAYGGDELQEAAL